MIVQVTFPNSDKIYHYNISEKLAKTLVVGEKYNITSDIRTYGDPVTIKAFLFNSEKATVTIKTAVPLKKDLAPATTNGPKTRTAPRAEDLVKNIIFSGPATIVMWKDGTKTMIKCHDEDYYDRAKAVALCFMKKMFGNTSEFNEVLRKYIPEDYEQPNPEDFNCTCCSESSFFDIWDNLCASSLFGDNSSSIFNC